VLLDLMLPDGDGLDLADEIHAATTAPILMLSAKNAPHDVVEGLLRGGDGYMTKPYRVDELCARVLAMLRQESRRPPVGNLRRGQLTLDVMAGRAYLAGQDLLLTPQECALLQFFLRNEGRVVSYEEVYIAVWRQPLAGSLDALRAAVSKLRRKLEPGGFCIDMSRNTGYRFSWVGR